MTVRELVAAAVAIGCGCAVLTGPEPAGAAWSLPVTVRTSGTMTAAGFGHTFTALGGGTGGAAYASASLTVPSTAYADLRNDSTVPAVLSATVTGTALVPLGSVTVRVDTCSVAWNRTTGSCSGTTTVVSPAAAVTSRPTADWATLASGGSAHARVVVAGSTGLVMAVAVTATQRPTTAGRDRTNG